MRILLVEDDAAIGDAVRDHIASDGHAVDWAKNLEDARALTEVARYGLIVLDLHLPDGDGVDFIRHIRGQSDGTPIIAATARDQVSDRIRGLNAGADDYLVKPFDLGELSARIYAVARRGGTSQEPLLEIGSLTIKAAERVALREGKLVELTAREWAVLDCLIRRPGTIVTKAQIEEALYEFGAEVESNTVEVYVSRVRKKLGFEFVTTVRGIGYRSASA